MFGRLPNDGAQANAQQNRRRETAVETGHGLGVSWEQQGDCVAHAENAAKDLVAIIPLDTFAYGDSTFTFGSMGGALLLLLIGGSVRSCQITCAIRWRGS